MDVKPTLTDECRKAHEAYVALGQAILDSNLGRLLVWVTRLLARALRWASRDAPPTLPAPEKEE